MGSRSAPHVSYRLAFSAGLICRLRVMFGVVSEVIALAPETQIVVCAMLRNMIKVSDRANDRDNFESESRHGTERKRRFIRAGTIRRSPMPVTSIIAVNHCTVRHAAKFALVASTLTDALADLFPVFRISRQVFLFDWHGYLTDFSRLDCAMSSFARRISLASCSISST